MTLENDSKRLKARIGKLIRIGSGYNEPSNSKRKLSEISDKEIMAELEKQFEKMAAELQGT